MATGNESQEIIIETLEPYVAAVGTAFPALSAEPASEWKLVGRQGDLNMSEAGATVTISQAISKFIPAGTPRPRKIWRTEEEWSCAFEVADMTPATLALILDNITVETGPPTKVKIERTFEAHLYALLLRGTSPTTEGKHCQFQVSNAYQVANQTAKFAPKGGPAFLAVQFDAVEAEKGKWVEFTCE